jgi:hypothetical protein
MWYHKKTNHPSHVLVHDHEKQNKIIKPILIPCAHGKTLNQDCSSCIAWSHNGINWDTILLEDVQEKFGEDTVSSLFDTTHFQLEPDDLDDFVWLINSDDGSLQVRVGGRIFLLDLSTDSNQWKEYIT